MTSLASIEQLEIALGRDVDDVSRAKFLLDTASATVRLATGQQFDLAETTERFRIRRGYVKLSQRPVVAVSAVVDVNTNPVLFEWLGGERVKVSPNVIDDFAWEPWSSGLTVVDVTYEHGFAVIPDDIIGIVVQVAGRALGTTPDQSALQSENLGAYGYSTGGAAASGAAGLLAGERAILEAYRRTAGTVSVDR